jgi:glycosyltransferase involved in cell wall biosynthesis
MMNMTAACVRLSSLTAFFPVHNEEENVLEQAEALLRVLPDVASRWELIIVDDGSTDATGALARNLARANPGVRVVSHPRRRGYGAALRTGFAAARGEYVFFTDGDRQFDADQITRLVARVRFADAVVGYRSRRADGFLRRLNGLAWSALTRLLLGVPARDVDCAFKLFRRRALSGLTLVSEGAMISAELLARLARRGARVVEVGVDHHPRVQGASTGGDPRVILRAFRELAGLTGAIRSEAVC